MPVYRGDTRSQSKEVTNDVLRYPYKDNKMEVFDLQNEYTKVECANVWMCFYLSMPVYRGHTVCTLRDSWNTHASL